MEYEPITVENPFGGAALRVRITESTMADARLLAHGGYPSGTVIRADGQTAGRGRVEGRRWDSPLSQSLLCTVLLRMAPCPGFTLRVGLAVTHALDAWLPADNPARIKWPNDVLSGRSGKKLAGILCENDGEVLYAGTGFNIAQKTFPPEIARKATSLSLEGCVRLPSPDELLETYLNCLRDALALDDWQSAVTEKLLYRGERISFLEGDPGRHETLDGTVEGIGTAGELLFDPIDIARFARGDTQLKPDENGLLHLWSGEIPYPCDR